MCIMAGKKRVSWNMRKERRINFEFSILSFFLAPFFFVRLPRDATIDYARKHMARILNSFDSLGPFFPE